MKKIIFAVIIFIAGIAIAAELQSLYMAKFLGLNDTVNVRLLQDSESTSMTNFNLNEIGALTERPIFGKYNSSSGALGSNSINGLFKHYTTNAKYFIACAGSNVAKGVGGVFSSIANTASTVASTKYWTGFSYNEKFYMFNPSIDMQVFDTHSNIYTPLGVPQSKCSFGVIHKARAWAARSDIYPYRLYYSSLNTAENWTTTGGYIDLPGTTQEITGLVSWGGNLFIFTETSIYVIQGSSPADFSMKRTASQVGCIAPRSIKITDVGIIFLARSGVYSFDGSMSHKLTSKIENIILNMSSSLIVNACSEYDGLIYYLAYTPKNSSYNNAILLYDIALKEWYKYSGDSCNVSYFCRAYGGTDKGELFGGSSIADGIVYQLQESGGSETITHSVAADFNAGVTSNTIVDVLPSVLLEGGAFVDNYNWTKTRKYNESIDASTNLLLHFNGADGATAYVSEDANLQTVSFAAGEQTQLDTTTKKFGSASLELDGNSDQVNVPHLAAYDLGNTWTIEGWVNFTAFGTSAYLIYNQDLIPPYAGWSLSINTSTITLINNDNTQYLSSSHTIGLNSWHHVAVTNDGTTIRMFLDGDQIANRASGAMQTHAGNLYIGGYGTPNSFAGHIDEVRISNIARWTTNFTPKRNEYPYSMSSGTLTSQGIQINNAGASTLGKISWIGNIPSNTNLTFQTRTGTTSDSVFPTGGAWEYWSSANSVTISTVTQATVAATPAHNMFKSNGAIYASAPLPTTFVGKQGQRRYNLYYEDEQSTSVNCVQFKVIGAASKGAYADGFLTYTDLSGYDWVTVWYKSPQTGNTVEFYMSNDYNSLSNNYVTFNTVTDNTVTGGISSGWSKGYWYIGDIPASERNGIRYIRVRYMGDTAGYLYLGEVEAHNYYDSDDTMTSTPNDFIQYRAILSTDDAYYTPELYSVVLVYSPVLTDGDVTLSSYYYTKPFEFGSPQINKQFDSLIFDVNSSTNSSVQARTLYCDYDIDSGTKTGTLSFPLTSTANTVRILKNFPASTYGKTITLKMYNDDKNVKVTIRGAELRYRKEQIQPN